MSAKDEARRLYHDIAGRLRNDTCYGQLSWTIQRDGEHTLDCNEMTDRIAAKIEQAEARGYKRGVNSQLRCRIHRCVPHHAVPLINESAAGAECGECIREQAEARGRAEQHADW